MKTLIALALALGGLGMAAGAAEADPLCATARVQAGGVGQSTPQVCVDGPTPTECSYTAAGVGALAQVEVWACLP